MICRKERPRSISDTHGTHYNISFSKRRVLNPNRYDTFSSAFDEIYILSAIFTSYLSDRRLRSKEALFQSIATSDIGGMESYDIAIIVVFLSLLSIWRRRFHIP